MHCCVCPDMLLYQYGKGIKHGPDPDASSTHSRAPADGNGSRSLAKPLKHHRHLQYPPLDDGCGRRKTLPSAMSSCLGLDPCHEKCTLALECPNPCWQLSLQAGGNQGRKIQVFVVSSSGRDCVSRKAPFSCSAAWFSLPSSCTTLTFFCVWSTGAAKITDLFQLSEGGCSIWKGISVHSFTS